MSELRRDPLTGDAVILAPGRRARPKDSRDDQSGPPACPFCPGQEHETPAHVLEFTLDGVSSWFTRVFPNRYPIVSASAEQPVGSFDSRAVTGIHEVVVETPLHEQEMARRTPEELLLTLKAYRQRLASLMNTPGIRYVTVFKNKGPEAGNSLVHPHSQITALSYVPDAVSQRVRRWRRYYAQEGRCLLCQELERERSYGSRVVLEQHGFVLYAAGAAARPGTMILAPVEHASSFAHATDAALIEFGRVLLSALKRLDSAFDESPYNLVLQTWPRSGEHDGALHWYLSIVPRLGVLGGFELSTGDYVSTLPAEDAAREYRGQAPPAA